MISIGDIDIGKVIIELQFQTKLNSLLIEELLNGRRVSQSGIEEIKIIAVNEVNKYYGGKQMVTYTPPKK